jgi:uncharacterized protein YndB with AHSA1/START domain
MTIAAIVQSVTVPVSPQHAFDLFTGRMGDWWMASHHIAEKPFVAIEIEPRTGGRWFERDEDGGECPWGKVIDWDPPHRVLLAWQLKGDFSYDPDFVTELEIAFEATDGGTRVTLTHDDLHKFGEVAPKVAAGMNEGWAALLGGYADFANKEDDR